ncbi:hypothetical protein EVAR_62690_1 [Eumeta japonica]|uniref:Uncharacterized protein n=1 Tax=Eumeta variegata TaxID=151549 RepID=A0A4C1ZTG8_EUMVA|nr:hypothetical protein EVAR_62690_1 [Eumeta japonica]
MSINNDSADCTRPQVYPETRTGRRPNFISDRTHAVSSCVPNYSFRINLGIRKIFSQSAIHKIDSETWRKAQHRPLFQASRLAMSCASAIDKNTEFETCVMKFNFCDVGGRRLRRLPGLCAGDARPPARPGKIVCARSTCGRVRTDAQTGEAAANGRAIRYFNMKGVRNLPSQ